jgi:hypothetical protein
MAPNPNEKHLSSGNKLEEKAFIPIKPKGLPLLQQFLLLYHGLARHRLPFLAKE